MEHIDNIIQNIKHLDLLSAIRYIHKNLIDTNNIKILITSHIALSHMHRQIQNVCFVKNYLVISQNIMGILNLYSIIPTELISQLSHNHHGFTGFLDIFNHIITYKLYKGWIRNHYYLEYDSKKTLKTTTNPTVDIIKSLASSQHHFSQNSRNQVKNFSTELELYFSGYLSQKNKSSLGLKKILQYFFQKKVSIIENHHQTLRPADNHRLKIGNLKINQQYNKLGRDSLVGRTSCNTHQSIKIILHNMSYKEYLSFHHSLEKLKLLSQIINNYLSSSIQVVIYAELDNATVLPCKISSQKKHQLGFSSWISGKCSNKTNLVSLIKRDKKPCHN